MCQPFLGLASHARELPLLPALLKEYNFHARSGPQKTRATNTSRNAGDEMWLLH